MATKSNANVINVAKLIDDIQSVESNVKKAIIEAMATGEIGGRHSAFEEISKYEIAW